jgi:hypothetical protein
MLGRLLLAAEPRNEEVLNKHLGRAVNGRGSNLLDG